jgi:predicted Zn-dependent peptidase
MTFQGRLDKGVDHQKAQTVFRQTIANIAKQGIPEKSLERLKKRLIKEAIRLGDDRNFTMNRAANLLSIGLLPNSSADDIERLEAITKAQVDSFLTALASATRKIEIQITPEKKQ